MNFKNIISTTEARKRLFEIVKEVSSPDIIYTLTERGKAKAIIMSAEEFEGWQETLELMSMFPNLKEEIKEAEEQFKKGEYITFEDFKKQLK